LTRLGLRATTNVIVVGPSPSVTCGSEIVIVACAAAGAAIHASRQTRLPASDLPTFLRPFNIAAA